MRSSKSAENTVGRVEISSNGSGPPVRVTAYAPSRSDLAPSAIAATLDQLRAARARLLERDATDVVRALGRVSALWVEAADSEPGRKMMDSFGLTEKPMGHEEVMKDYEVLKATIIPRIVALGIKPE